ncbi:MAG: hypothetical protein KGZ60_05850 [Truepera sp.]|nr:hypothetical protein [Truepera sp.]
MKRKLTPLTDPSQVPPEMSEVQAQAFWASHEVTDEYLARPQQEASEEPPVRSPVASRSITLRLEVDTLNRLKRLASRRQMGYQTLLKNFVLERLYDEEKRQAAR